MDAYVAAGGKLKGAKKKKPPAICVEKCPLQAHLVVRVRTSGGVPVEGVSIEVRSGGATRVGGTTNAEGFFDAGQTYPDSYSINAEKIGYAPGAISPVGPASDTVQVVENTTTICDLVLDSVQSVVRINAKVGGTGGVRVAAHTRPDQPLASSTTADEKLASNAPVILVRGCQKVKLDAVTRPANQPVKWSVKPNENSESAPSIEYLEGGKKAKLSTSKAGSFSVIAELGASKVVWNVVFVWVKVNVKTSRMKRRNKRFADSGSDATWTNFRSGQFFGHNYAWEGSVKVKLIGGGTNKKLGIGKVKLRILQNGIADTLTGNYAPGHTALEVPKGGIPIVDCTGAGSPFITTASCMKITPNNTAQKRICWSGDSPAGSFQRTHANTGTTLQNISGVNGFKIAVASTSDDAPNTINVHAETVWAADYAGTVSYGAPPGPVGTYMPTGAKVTTKKRFRLIKSSCGGQDAKDANYETFQPRFNQGTNTTWTP